MISKRKTKINIILFTVLCIILAGCIPNKDTSEAKKIDGFSSTSDIKLSNNNIANNPMLSEVRGKLVFKNEYIDYNNDYDVTYVNSDDFYLKNGEENPTTGRYSNVTEDGEINWNIEDTVRLDYTPIAKEMLSKVTLDGKKIVFPIKFENIDKELSIFDKVDFTKLTDDMYPFTITDVKNGNKLFLYSPHGEDTRIVHILNKNNVPLLAVEINLKKNIITGLSNEDAPYMAMKNLVVDGIGVGNTLNEAYKKFGVPKTYRPKTSALPVMSYNYKDDKKDYVVFFFYEDEFYLNSRNARKIKNNVITAVSVYFEEVE